MKINDTCWNNIDRCWSLYSNGRKRLRSKGYGRFTSPMTFRLREKCMTYSEDDYGNDGYKLITCMDTRSRKLGPLHGG